MKQSYIPEKINLIVVDDHSLVRKSLISVLERYDNINILADFGSGIDLLAKIEHYTPDVILLDVSMPDINGIETLRRLMLVRPELKVIGLTMHDDKEIINNMMKAGAKGYILKDSPFQELIKAIQQVNSGKIFYSSKVAGIILEDYTNTVQNKNEDDELLSFREKEIIGLVAQGLTNKQIGDKLFLSVRTVENHRQNIKRKLKIESTAELIKYAYSKGLVGEEN